MTILFHNKKIEPEIVCIVLLFLLYFSYYTLLLT